MCSWVLTSFVPRFSPQKQGGGESLVTLSVDVPRLSLLSPPVFEERARLGSYSLTLMKQPNTVTSYVIMRREGQGWCVRFSVRGFLQQCGVTEVVGLHDGGVQ